MLKKACFVKNYLIKKHNKVTKWTVDIMHVNKPYMHKETPSGREDYMRYHGYDKINQILFSLFQDQRTPLHLAAISNHQKTCEFLLSRNADITVLDKVCLMKHT